MKKRFVILLLVLIKVSLSFVSLVWFSTPVGNSGLILPDRVYEVYRVNPVYAKETNPIKIVNVNYNGDYNTHLVRSTSLIGALLDVGYPLSNRNKITATCPVSTLYSNSYVLIETYRTTIDEVYVEIPYEKIINGEVLCRSMTGEMQEQRGVMGVMTQKIEKIYRGDTLISETIIEEIVDREPVSEIVTLTGPQDLPTSVTQRGYDCTYWHSYVDGIAASSEEKQWLKFTMKWESGCNAENNKSFYKGLFQWSPCLWYVQYPNDNIFDGEAQIRRTLQKLREGADPNRMWPAVHRKYKATYGELSWLQ